MNASLKASEKSLRGTNQRLEKKKIEVENKVTDLKEFRVLKNSKEKEMKNVQEKKQINVEKIHFERNQSKGHIHLRTSQNKTYPNSRKPNLGT